ncbi:MAG: FAD-dependent pyridine nucleotide-disulfide oxidoreductase [Myxococcales bacterium]|nr:FAD-dependent pyridine nucleotide-disulfide oxidoreductase [Myxococcales bacterium]
MDRRLNEVPHGERLTLQFEGGDVTACAGESVAVALFASGENVLSRSIKYHRPRGFFCLAGHCGACLMRIDGKPNVRACKTPAKEGMRVERQNAFPTGAFDVLGAADFFFPKGMDHHTMMTSPRALNAVLNKVVRQLGGLGKLPDLPTPQERTVELPRPRTKHVDVVVVGGGPAGLGCATECARAGKKTLLVDEQDRVGGSLLAHPQHGVRAANEALAAALKAGVEVLSSSTVLAWYPEDAPKAGAEPGLLAVHTPDGLLKLTASRYVYATGSYDQNAIFTDNDRPGVLPARAVGRLLVRFGVRPAKKPVVVGDGPYAKALTDALAKTGATVTRIDGHAEQITQANGRSWVRSVQTSKQRTIKCDLVAVAALPAPASELPRQHGVPVAFTDRLGGFHCQVDEDGRSPVPHVFACGDVTGFGGIDDAISAGARCGRAVVASFSGNGVGKSA